MNKFPGRPSLISLKLPFELVGGGKNEGVSSKLLQSIFFT